MDQIAKRAACSIDTIERGQSGSACSEIECQCFDSLYQGSIGQLSWFIPQMASRNRNKPLIHTLKTYNIEYLHKSTDAKRLLSRLSYFTSRTNVTWNFSALFINSNQVLYLPGFGNVAKNCSFLGSVSSVLIKDVSDSSTAYTTQ